MKILYLAQFTHNINDGVNQKIRSQIDGLRKNFETVDLTYLVHKNFKNTENLPYSFFEVHTSPFNNLYQKLQSVICLKGDLEKMNFSNYDVIYLRTPIFPVKTILKLKKDGKIIVTEVVSYGDTNLFLRAKILFLIRKRRLNVSNFVVSVTLEIAEKYDLKQNVIEISNGIDTSRIQLLSNSSKSDKIRLICVAKFNRWHGIDRLLHGLKKYKNAKIFKIILVGFGLEFENIKRLSKALDMGEIVEFHGFMKGQELDELYSKVDIGIGNLGIHRKGLTFTSPLKSREYCSRGLPFIYAGRDTDFENVDFTCQFPANEDSIDIEKICNFYELIKKDKSIQQRMRNYADNNLGYHKKFEALKLALEKFK